MNADAPTFPVDSLPPLIRNAVYEVQRFVKCPHAIVAASALSAVSLACQFNVDVSRKNGLSSPTSLNFLTLAESGERKSACDILFTKSVFDFEFACNEEILHNNTKFKTAVLLWDQKRKELKRKITRQSKAGENYDDTIEELAQLEAKKPSTPSTLKLIFGDVTPEAIAENLSRWPSIAIFSDEAGALFGSHTLKNLGMLNQLWGG